MKKKLIRIFSVFSAVLLMLILSVSIAYASGTTYGGKSVPILYYNDRAWSLSSRFPAEADENGVYYIPLTVFVQLPEVDVRINETLQTFIITKKDKYLSFDTATGYAANQDKVRFPLETYERQGERYVPAETVCSYLGLGYEKLTSPANGEDALRITDGHESYSFITLLRRKEPGFYEETVVETVPSVVETDPPETEPPAPTLTERTIYITIEDSPGEYTADILSVLDDFGVKATFFVIGDNLVSNLPMLSAIVADGHAVALHTMSHNAQALTDTDAVISDIEKENSILSKAIKLNAHAWRGPDGYRLSSDGESALESAGYSVWDYNVDVPSVRSYQASSAAINGIWNNRTAVLRFCECKYTAETLKQVLKYISDNSEVCELRVISGAFEPLNGEK